MSCYAMSRFGFLFILQDVGLGGGVGSERGEVVLVLAAAAAATAALCTRYDALIALAKRKVADDF
jgi:hypothetical protein